MALFHFKHEIDHSLAAYVGAFGSIALLCMVCGLLVYSALRRIRGAK